MTHILLIWYSPVTALDREKLNQKEISLALHNALLQDRNNVTTKNTALWKGEGRRAQRSHRSIELLQFTGKTQNGVKNVLWLCLILTFRGPGFSLGTFAEGNAEHALLGRAQALHASPCQWNIGSPSFVGHTEESQTCGFLQQYYSPKTNLVYLITNFTTIFF